MDWYMWVLVIAGTLIFRRLVWGSFFGSLRKKDKKAENVRVFAFVSQQGKGISLEEAKALQDRFLSSMTTDSVSNKINAAAKMTLSGMYEESIEAYKKIAEQHPDRLGVCESQVGASLFFLGRYKEAISYYKKAIEHGEDLEMMNENIKEAEEALQKA